MKKMLTMLLALVMLVSVIPGASAAAPDNTGNSVYSNRYYYKTVTYDRFLSGSHKISQEDIDSFDKALSVAQFIVSKAGIAGDVLNLTYNIGMAIYDMNVPGTMETYRTVKEKIKVDDLTKEEQVVETWWTVEFILYNTNGDKHNEQTHTIRIK